MIKIVPEKERRLNRAMAMPPSLLEANKDWNTFVEKNRGWIKEYRDKMASITADLLVVDSVIKERLQECFEDNQPLSGQFLALRKRLMDPQNLPQYQQNLGKMNMIDAPTPYYRNLLLDEDVREEIDHMKRKMNIRKR